MTISTSSVRTVFATVTLAVLVIIAIEISSHTAARALATSGPVARIAITFDNYSTTYNNAFFTMINKGLMGTFYVDSSKIGLPGNPNKDNLILMKASGWEIGARVYDTVGGQEANMVTSWNNNRDLAADRLRIMKDEMHALDMDITSIAASQRAWSNALRNLAVGSFKNVRVADDTSGWQSFPVPDPLYVRRGGTPSLSGSDTAAALCSKLDTLISSGGLWIVVVHKVSDDGDANYSIPIAQFNGFIDCVAQKRSAGLLEVDTFDEAIR